METPDERKRRENETDEEREKRIEHTKKYGYLARILAALPKTNIDARPRVPLLHPTATIGPTALKFFKSFEELAQIQISSK